MENDEEDDIRPLDRIIDDLVIGKDFSREELRFLKDNLDATAKIIVPYYFPNNKWIRVLKDLFTCEFAKLGLFINTPFDCVFKWRLQHGE